MSINKMKIGEFSRLCRVSVRALRHYEKIGLVVPEIIDRSTGYRYYSVGQMQKMAAVKSFQSMGFSLSEIKELYEDNTHIPSVPALEEKMKQCREELFELTERLDKLQAVVLSYKKKETMEKISFTSLPSVTVASYRAVIPSYEELGRLCVEAIAPEMARLGCECPEPGYCFSIEHGGYKAENVDIEYCEQVKEARKDSNLLKFKTLPEVETAACLKYYGPYSGLYQAYIELFEYLEKEQWKIVGQPRASYVDGIWNEEDPQKWLTIIQVPVEKA